MVETLKAIITEYNDKRDEYNSLCQKMARLIEELLSVEKIPYSSITGRVKSVKSITNKVEKKIGKYKHINDMTDIVGIRIITYYSDDVDQVAELIKREFHIDFDNSIDKREALDPDRFGYLSLHFVCGLSDNRLVLPEYANLIRCKFEIQIRSILQHTWAEIEHDLGYKSEVGIPREIRRNFSRLAGLLEIADKEFVDIRDKLNQYEKDVLIQLTEDRSEEVLIDEVSLKTFINSNPEIIELNKRIANIIHAKIIPNKSLKDSIEELLWFKLTTIHDIFVMLEKHKELAYEIAVKFLSGYKEEKTLGSSIGLLYVCYAELLSSDYSDDQINDFLTSNNFYDLEGTSTVIMLRNAYKEIKEKIKIKDKK
jgi:ppGpp synthetase/RelA/SpoT-type nucleotidyltranferase